MKTNHHLVTLVLYPALLPAECSSQARVGVLWTESQSVELGDADSVYAAIQTGASELNVVSGGVGQINLNVE